MVDRPQNFEWVSTTNYATDDVVTYSGKWWQSLVNSNIGNIPGADLTKWNEVDKSPSGLVFWQAGVYTEDEVFVLREINSTVFLFRLDPLQTRPFNSTDFDAELSTNTWQEVARLDTVIVDTSGGTLHIDMLKLQQLSFVESAQISGNKIIAFDNTDRAKIIHFFRFSLDAPRVLSFPMNTRMSDARWDNTTQQWTALDAGSYEMTATYDGSHWYVKMGDTFT